MSRKNTYSKSICHWPEEDRPREKLAKYGEQSLTNSELLAVLLRTGCCGQSALDLARSILHEFKTFRNISQTDDQDWDQFKGIGSAKLAQIKAALEIGRRFREMEITDRGEKVKSAADIATIMMPHMRDLKTEIFKVIFLNSQSQIIEIVDEAKGTVNYAIPILREIFQKAIQRYAVSIVCLHNHPSGIARPSPDDITFTKKLVEAGKIMRINVLDHIIIGDDRYYSFCEEGRL